MWTYLRDLWFDKITARTLLLTVIALGAAYYNTPAKRPWQERFFGAAAMTLPVTGAALAMRRKGE